MSIQDLFHQLTGSNGKNPVASEGGMGVAARSILDFVGNAAITTDAQGRIEYLNPIAETLTGWTNQEARALHCNSVLRFMNQMTGQPLDNKIENVLLTARTSYYDNHSVLIKKGGQHYATEGSIAPMFSGEGKLLGAIIMLHDMSKSRELSQSLAHQANHDALTGLVNRREFESRAKRALDAAKTNNTQHALCYMDLDQFKIVNDTCGHSAGDELLRQVTKLLQSKLRERDTLARLGGDEFGLLLEGCDLDNAERIAQELLTSVKNFRFSWKGRTFTIGISIGITAINANSTEIATVMSASDSACYAAKEKGRNRVQSYRSGDLELAERQKEMLLVSRISKAVDENRFTLFFQPIIALNRVPRGKHIEILTRMLGPQNQLVPPSQFIPAAERYNLMPALDRWIIQNTFSAYHQFYGNDNGRATDTWAINISGTSFSREGFIDFIREQCALHSVPPQAICFEITETAAIANVNKAVDFIWGLKIDGFRFALDDFGKGMSSFAYLKNLPVDYLKIDGDFVKDIMHDKISLGMVEAINRIGQLMGLQTIAEFAEDEQILAKLKEVGVDYAQGYAYGQPMALDLYTKVQWLDMVPMQKSVKIAV